MVTFEGPPSRFRAVRKDERFENKVTVRKVEAKVKVEAKAKVEIEFEVIKMLLTYP